jgi:hypothetical protein
VRARFSRAGQNCLNARSPRFVWDAASLAGFTQLPLKRAATKVSVAQAAAASPHRLLFHTPLKEIS